MNPDTADLALSCAIPFCLALYGVLVAKRIIGTKPGVDPTADEWHRKYDAILLRWGRVLMIIGALLAIIKILQPNARE